MSINRYGYNKERRCLNEITEFFASRRLAVDFLHFKNHVGKWCKENMDPYKYDDLKSVNTVVCEQQFSWSNHMANVKAMNEERFSHYWLYVLDLHNHHIEKNLEYVTNPLSKVRQASILASAIEKFKL